MKRVISILISTMLFFSVGIFAEQQFGVVDMQQIFQQAPQVKQINDDLTKQFASRRDNIMKMTKDFQDNLQKYQKDKSVMSSQDLDKLKDTLTTEEGQLRQEQTKFQQDLYDAQNTQMKTFLDKIKAIVQQVASDKKLSLVLPKNSVLYVDNGLDITPDVIAKLK